MTYDNDYEDKGLFSVNITFDPIFHPIGSSIQRKWSQFEK